MPVARGTWDFHWLLLCTDNTRKSIRGVCMFEGHRQGFFDETSHGIELRPHLMSHILAGHGGR